MKKRILAAIMMILVVFSCFAITASAKTVKGRLHEHDKWTYSTSVTTGKYKSTYIDCTSKKYCGDAVWAIADNSNTHRTKVTNNQDGLTSGWVYAKCSREAKATVKANWWGKNGTASISCWL